MANLHEHYAKAQDWWKNLAQREQRMLFWGGITAFLLLYYFAFLSPMQQSIQSLKSTIQENNALYQWMEQASDDIAQTSTAQVAAAKTLPLLSLIEKTLKTANLSTFAGEIKLLKKNEVRIKLNDVNFEKGLKWLNSLNRVYSLSINKVILRATDKVGVVQMDATVQK